MTAKTYISQNPRKLLQKQGVSGQKGVNDNNDKDTFYLPRQHLELGVKKSVFMGIVAVLVITVAVDLQLKIG